MLHYYLKQAIGLLGMPLVVRFVIVALALAYQLRGRTRAACRLYLVAALMSYLASIRIVGDAPLPALWLMRRAGAHAIPAPVGQRALGIDGSLIGALIPGSSGLYETEHALHEYIGLLAMTLRLD